MNNLAILTIMEINDKVPNISFTATNNTQAYFEDFLGKWLIIYFYPKDATPGCTTEGCDFRDNFYQLKDINATVFGVSRDTISSHEKFKSKQQFPFELISDKDEELCNAFKVIKMKNMYGKQVRGIERSTFIIGPDNKIEYIWRNVKVTNHVVEVLTKLKELQNKLYS